MDSGDGDGVTIDELALGAGTTTRRIRSFQTLGLLPHPALRGRTGLYDTTHRNRLAAVLRLQEQGFSLESLVILFDALEAGRSLPTVLGLPASSVGSGPAGDGGPDSAELYGFAELQPTGRPPRRSRALLSVVPTTVWESQAS